MTAIVRIKGTVSYDGTDFEGWQSQVNGNTIQDILEKRLAFLLEKRTRIYGASRTDAGVHARGQVFHFDAEWQHRLEHLERGFQSNIPETIRIVSLEEVRPDFNARTDARGKRYIYTVTEGLASPFDVRYCWSLGKLKLDLERMQRAARHLTGKHDFSAFAGSSPGGKDPNPVKDLRLLKVEQEGKRYRITTEGSGYLYKMVRSLVGALVDVGHGRLEVDEVRDLLHGKKRTARVRTAPARGLILDEVFYE